MTRIWTDGGNAVGKEDLGASLPLHPSAVYLFRGIFLYSDAAIGQYFVQISPEGSDELYARLSDHRT